MRFAGALVVALAAALAVTPLTSAQARRGQAASSQALLDYVEVVGCLTAGANDTWSMTNATTPVAVRRPTSTPEAVKAAEAKALGSERFRVLNIAVFNPTMHEGHKMVARGLLLKDSPEPRVNLLSLQMVSPTCSR
jgi:hypothetical protein